MLDDTSSRYGGSGEGLVFVLFDAPEVWEISLVVTPFYEVVTDEYGNPVMMNNDVKGAFAVAVCNVFGTVLRPGLDGMLSISRIFCSNRWAELNYDVADPNPSWYWNQLRFDIKAEPNMDIVHRTGVAYQATFIWTFGHRP